MRFWSLCFCCSPIHMRCRVGLLIAERLEAAVKSAKTEGLDVEYREHSDQRVKAASYFSSFQVRP